MKRTLHLGAVIGDVAALPPQLRARLLRTIEDLVDTPEPLGARPYGGIPDAFEFVTDLFTLRYTYGEDHVSIWVVRANT
ncbi:hypothetical protein Acor_15960 [Acrocarpospora corrugata]|uniref:Type II toxin-antitoxin system RelE/ParE family toxin n=1 Tax=Acrocarpospora corrugata TaxID=35763 RepID=A0A5M3VWR6_9ACTN|nr:hypothetical protein Acor_15960 [Acrocarpospora corrugata]